MKIIYLCVLAALCGCAHPPRKQCNLERIQRTHADLPVAFAAHRELLMDMMHTIAVLEQEAGGYQ